MNNNGCIIPEIDEQNIGVQQENATFLVIGDEAYTSEIIEEYNRNAAAKTEEFNTNATNKTNDFNTNYDNKLEAFNSNAVTKTEDFDSHVTAQTTNFNNNAETATVNFNKNAAQQTDEFNKNAMSYSQSIEENKKNIASTSNELYHLKTDILETGESSGNNIHLEDSAWAEMQEIKVDGVCEQVTTTGANLYDYQNISNPSQEENGWITLSADNSSGSNYKYVNYFTRPMNLKPDTQYNVFVEIKNVSGTFSSLVISSDDVNTSIQQFVNPSWKATFSSLKSGYIVNKILTSKSDFSDVIIGLRTFLAFDAGNSGSVTFRISVIEDITITPANFVYQPFTNGQPSPSPDYPQEIKTITDSLKITSCGKNVFSVNIPTTTRNGITVSQDDNGIHVQGTSTNISNFLFPTKILNRLAGKTITLTCADLTNSNIQNISFKSPATNTVYCAIDQNVTSRTYTLPVKIADDTVFSIYILKDMTINVTLKIQVEIGNKTAYEPYVESLIEANLPEGEFIGYINATNYDALSTKYNSNAGAYQLVLNKCIAKITIDGTKGSFSMPSAGRFNIDNIINDYLKTSQSYGITTKCDNYISFSQTLSNSDFDNLTSGYNYGIGLGGGTANNIRIKNVNFSNVEDFKNNLRQHPITLYYILNVESRQTIDLGTIDMPLTYDEITNIFTDSSLLPTINVKYYRNFIATIQNLQVNNDTLKNELSNIESRLTALESANTNIESRLTTLENANKNVADSNPTEESEVTE